MQALPEISLPDDLASRLRRRQHSFNLLAEVRDTFGGLASKKEVINVLFVGGSVARLQADPEEVKHDVDIIVYPTRGDSGLNNRIFDEVHGLCCSSPLATIFEVRNSPFEGEMLIPIADLINWEPPQIPRRLIPTLEGLKELTWP